jgi:hypothetical protein
MAKVKDTYKDASYHNLVAYPEYVKNIGMVALETVDLEIRLANLFGRIIGLTPRKAQAIYFSPKAEQARMDIIRNAAKATFHVTPLQTGSLARQKRAALEKVEALLERSEKLIRKRHRVIHDEWNISEKEKKVTRRLVGGEPVRPRTPVEIEELTDLIGELRLLIDDVYALSEEFRKHPPTMVSLRRNVRD